MSDPAQPLNNRIPIVGSYGVATDYFIQWAQQFSEDTATVSDVAEKVTGPGSSTDNAIVRFNGTTGKLVQNSGVTIDDADIITSPASIIIQTASFAPMSLRRYQDASFSQGFEFIKARGSVSSPTGVQSGDQLARFMARGYIDDDTLPVASSSDDFLSVTALETFTSSARGTRISFNTKATGSTVGVTRLALDSAVAAFSVDVTVPDEAYGSSWNGSLEVPTKNAVYDKIESLPSGGGGSWALIDSWDFSIDGAVSQITVTGLGSYSEILISSRLVTRTNSSVGLVQVSTDGGSTYFSTSGNYVISATTGVETAVADLPLHSTVTTSARSGFVLLQNTSGLGVPSLARCGNDSNRFFVADLSNAIDAVRIMPSSGGGNFTGGQIWVSAR